MNKSNTTLFAFCALLAFVPFARAGAGTRLQVDFETSPLFSEASFMPGDTVIRSATTTNLTAESMPIAVKAANINNADGLGDTMRITISQGETILSFRSGRSRMALLHGTIFLCVLLQKQVIPIKKRASALIFSLASLAMAPLTRDVRRTVAEEAVVEGVRGVVAGGVLPPFFSPGRGGGQESPILLERFSALLPVVSYRKFLLPSWRM